jgi:hypothetical protein
MLQFGFKEIGFFEIFLFEQGDLGLFLFQAAVKGDQQDDVCRQGSGEEEISGRVFSRVNKKAR